MDAEQTIAEIERLELWFVKTSRAGKSFRPNHV
jgi:hypothetical protein